MDIGKLHCHPVRQQLVETCLRVDFKTHDGDWETNNFYVRHVKGINFPTTSQSGPLASRAFTTIPCTKDFAYPSYLFPIFFSVDFGCPLLLFAGTRWCRRIFDSLGDCRAACSQRGVVRSRGGPLAKPACGSPTRLADFNVEHVQHIDDGLIAMQFRVGPG